jgi:tripartite-type tricarboxylate transporter receptor subunit TctC
MIVIALRRWLVLLVAAGVACTGAMAQDFPSKPVKIVVGFGPGGLGDISTRAVAQRLSTAMGQSFIIENMPGAGGITAAANVAKATPDGHTLLLVSGQNATAPLLFKSLAYDFNNDFATVSTIGTFHFIIVVAKDSPLKSLSDLVARAKSDPDRFNLGTIASGSLQNLMSHLFVSRAGIKVPTVPFKTTGDLISALLAGEIQAVVETVPGVIGHVQSGQLRALGTSAEGKTALLPDVPTAGEAGVSGYAVTSWNGFVAPAKTPREVVLKLNAAIAKALALPGMRKQFAELGLEATPSSPEEMRKIYNDDVERWRGVIAGANLKIQ